MLRISKLTDYAMLIMSYMAREPDQVISATTLAERLHLTPPTVSKILKMLAEKALVTSMRGAEGGYRLARPITAISLIDIITAMEGEIAMTECCTHTALCALESMCLMRENWMKINTLIHSILNRYNLSDLMRPLAPIEVEHGK